MINNSANIFSQFNTIASSSQAKVYSGSKKNIQINANQDAIRKKKNNSIKKIALFTTPTIIGTGIGIKAKTLYARLSEDTFQKQYKELDKKLITNYREDEISKKYLEYIDVIKNRIDENIKGIEKSYKLLKSLNIPYEKEELKEIITSFESENKKLGEELVTAQKEHRTRYREIIEKPLTKFKDEHLKKLSATKKKICTAGIIGGILTGALVTYFYYRKNKGYQNEN